MLRMARIGFVGQVPMKDVAVKRPVPAQNASTALVKDAVADRLRAEIASGALRPGIRIVEGYWARKFGVAQASIREAINLLAKKALLPKLRAAARASSTCKCARMPSTCSITPPSTTRIRTATQRIARTATRSTDRISSRAARRMPASSSSRRSIRSSL
jgi:hypothetical protein